MQNHIPLPLEANLFFSIASVGAVFAQLLSMTISIKANGRIFLIVYSFSSKVLNFRITGKDFCLKMSHFYLWEMTFV